jgi:hypothetical protein
MAAIATDPRRSNVGIARELGVTTRTVRKARKRLGRAGQSDVRIGSMASLTGDGVKKPPLAPGNPEKVLHGCGRPPEDPELPASGPWGFPCAASS